MRYHLDLILKSKYIELGMNPKEVLSRLGMNPNKVLSKLGMNPNEVRNIFILLEFGKNTE